MAFSFAKWFLEQEHHLIGLKFQDHINEANRSIHFTVWSNDGTVVVYIDQTRYVFIVDVGYHKQLRKIVKYRPWSVLNKIKKMVANGHARQINPTPTPKKPEQKTLF